MDLFVGLIIDGRKNIGSSGKFRLVMMILSIIFVIFIVVIFIMFNVLMIIKIIYVYVIYMIWGVMYLFINVFYGLLVFVMIRDVEERSELVIFR